MSIFHFFFLLTLIKVSTSAVVSNDLGRLIKDIGKDYDIRVDPGHGTELQAGMTILCSNLDQRSRIATTRVLERYTWKDSRLTWTPSAYGGIQKIVYPANQIWTPDVQLINTVDKTETRDEVKVHILSNGTVYWIPPTTYRTVCSAKDDEHSHHCQFLLGSWAYDGPSLPLSLFESGVDTKIFLSECPYSVRDASAVVKRTKYECCPEPYDSIEVSFDVIESNQSEGKITSSKKPRYSWQARHQKCNWPNCP